jgi:hypothetical protein
MNKIIFILLVLYQKLKTTFFHSNFKSWNSKLFKNYIISSVYKAVLGQYELVLFVLPKIHEK